jgi:GDP-L-fucose synthase
MFILNLENNTPLVISGSGKPLRQFIYSLDLAKLMIWALFHYNNDPFPLILSVNEEDELSIAEVARHVATAMDFKGPIIVSNTFNFSLIQPKPTANLRRQHQIRN